MSEGINIVILIGVVIILAILIGFVYVAFIKINKWSDMINQLDLSSFLHPSGDQKRGATVNDGHSSLRTFYT